MYSASAPKHQGGMFLDAARVCHPRGLGIRSRAMVEQPASDAGPRAQPAGAAPDRAGSVKLVCFRIHGREYGVPIDDVKETMPLRPITRVFLTPPWLAGIINLRGDIVAVIDLARFSGLEPTHIQADSRILICRHDGKVAGVVVDELCELRVLDRARVEAPPSTLADSAAALLAGVATVEGGAPLAVLDMGKLFQSERLRAFQRGES